MGAYLSHPKTEKESTDERNKFLVVGSSSMQGWRNTQEDAHNAILNFDTNTSFFAVYDGHGGAEVAAYCAENLPEFLKKMETYQKGDFEKALKEAFLGFDSTLLEEEVVKILKCIAKHTNEFADDSDDQLEDLAELHKESHLPLDQVLQKYKEGGPSMPLLKNLQEDDDDAGSKPQSPYLRGRRAAAVIADAVNRAAMDPNSKPQGSSTSAAARAAFKESGPSSSKNSRMEVIDTEEDSTVSSSSFNANKLLLNTSKNKAAVDENVTKNEDKTANSSTSASHSDKASESAISVKEKEQNGSVSSSAVKVTEEHELPTSTPAVDEPTASDDEGRKIQNGTVGSTSSSSNQTKSISEAERSTISSTSNKDEVKEKKVSNGEGDSSEDDEDYEMETSDVEESEAHCGLGYSSDDEELDDEDEGNEADEEDDEAEEEDDPDAIMATEQFCNNMMEEPGKDSGCTAVVALLRGRDLYVANAGDSRCVVCRNGKAIDMSLDHKPEDHEESARIIKAGGRVTGDGRVMGGLNLSRAIGDHAYKMNLALPAEEQMITALPDVKKLVITEEDEFMILACDGIWNFMTSEEVVEFVRSRISDKSKKMSDICEELFDRCLAPNTLGDGTGCDNMTAVIIRFESALLELPTVINTNDTQDKIESNAEVDSANVGTQNSLKRSASPTLYGESTNETDNSNKIKRLKTDQETPTSSAPGNQLNNVNVTTSSSNTVVSSGVEIVEEDNCESVST